MAPYIKRFFKAWEEAWEAVPGYAKAFLYSTCSVLIGTYIAGQEITVRTVVIIVATNVGLYQIPREGTKQIKKML